MEVMISEDEFYAIYGELFYVLQENIKALEDEPSIYECDELIDELNGFIEWIEEIKETAREKPKSGKTYTLKQIRQAFIAGKHSAKGKE